MLSKDQLDFLWSIEVSCERAVRAARYFDAVSASRTNVWSFTQNCYGAESIIRWCQVFGAYTEPTHYSKLFAQGMIGQMSKENISDRLRASIAMDKGQYRTFWKAVTTARNQYFAHSEFGAANKPTFPDTDLIQRMCLEMRDIVREILHRESSSATKQLDNMKRFTAHHTNARYLSEVDNGVRALSKAITSQQR